MRRDLENWASSLRLLTLSPQAIPNPNKVMNVRLRVTCLGTPNHMGEKGQCFVQLAVLCWACTYRGEDR